MLAVSREKLASAIVKRFPAILGQYSQYKVADFCREAVLDEAAETLGREYPDNVNTNAFCAAIRSLKESK